MNVIEKYNRMEPHDQATARKLIIGSIAALSAFIIGRKVYNAIKENTRDTDLNNTTAYSTRNMTISESRAQLLANKLLDAMDRVGTDTDMIDEVVNELQNKDDWACVIYKFGNQPYYLWGKSLSSSADSLNLVGWFRRELSGDRLSNIISKLNEYNLNIG